MPRFKKEVKGAYTNENKAERATAKQYLSEYTGVNTQPPDYLSDLAKEIFKSTIQATKKDNLKQIDMPLLATFSQVYANVIEASEHINKDGLVVDGKASPYERILNKEVQQLRALAVELGFTPNTRARIEMNRAKNHDKPENDPFIKVLSSRG
ncbi:phage terminase small subunit P27 family [Lactobacillus reuteri]|uniref:phage terminase small subunit P27 family n=1 Tax=Limosilactobacillus reuteri TaxID=1598 RepID=UPI00146ABF08|nr:phage terminase small subunit P27 family [Limosilactobacillus reuteri]NMV55524.1 phage terminase small subunit P27 family [Limosilactobacillus reuteri]